MSVCYNKSRKKYFICYDLKMPDGSFKTISIYNKEWTKEKGKKYMQAIERAEIDKDIRKRKLNLHKGDNITLMELYEMYLNDIYLNFSEQTAMAKKIGLNKYMLPIFNMNKELDVEWTVQNIEKFKANIISCNHSLKRTNDVLRYLRELIMFASDREFISFDLARKLCNLLKSITNNKNLDYEETVESLKFWTGEQWKQFYDSFDDHDDWKLYFEVSYYAALRIGEAIGLKWSDLNLANNTIYIKRSIQNNGKPGKTKNQSSNAPVYLPKNLIFKLLEYKKQSYATNDDWIFFSKGKTSKNTVRRKMKDHIIKSGVPEIPPHGLRHSCASRLINAGCSPLMVSKHLRHSSVKETLDTYAHMFPSDTQGIIDSVFS